GIDPPEELIELANKRGVPVLQTQLTTTEFISRLAAYLDNYFSPSVTNHGTLMDVYGVGLLYTGKSGIGKSECALDLVERGHRLVADDMVKIRRTAPEVLVGSGTELLGHHMEIRGLGIIDIEKLFGIRSIRLQKRIEVEVRLVAWEDTHDYERLGIEDQFTRILGVEMPVVTVPLSPGKNITVISEVIAMTHMLKVYGQNPAAEFSRRLTEELARKSVTAEYLESDYE
ncbi:MAG: HPr(Ser) kinase/phosphatase, partial [candidate division Zixibacteria bacterium]|nr:HPr(Ser) kinase/phosphatase [candidate division Zixibacteria bacterium]